MSSPDKNYISRNNYNFALNEDFEYLDELHEELKKAEGLQKESSASCSAENRESEEGENKPFDEAMGQPAR